MLDHVEPDDFRIPDECIRELVQNPYPPPSRLGPLVVPGRAVYPQAFACHGWRIGYEVVEDLFICIGDIGRWPPLRGRR